MKFDSRKDITFSLVIFGLMALLIGIPVIGIATGGMEQNEYWILIPILGFLGLFLWFYFGTNYELTTTELIYRCGPFNGKIKIDRITEIVKGHTPWIGSKYATARKGLNIKFDTYNEIYISPKNEEVFINEIVALNSGIKLSEG